MKLISLIILALSGFFTQVGVTGGDVIVSKLPSFDLAHEVLATLDDYDQPQERISCIQKPSNTPPAFLALFSEFDQEEEEESGSHENFDFELPFEKSIFFAFEFSSTPSLSAIFEGVKFSSTTPLFIFFEVYRL